MNIYNVIILDESGSMSSIYKETLTSMNEVLSGIRKNQTDFPDQHHHVTIVTFEGDGLSGVKTRRDRCPIASISPFTRQDYRPGGCTPLYDAMGKTLTELERLVFPEDKVIATIITDGYENSSQEYSSRTIKDLVGRLKEKGWVFAYIGANQDSIEAARDINISNALDFDASEDGMRTMACHLTMANHNLASKLKKSPKMNLCDYSAFFEEEEESKKKKK